MENADWAGPPEVGCIGFGALPIQRCTMEEAGRCCMPRWTGESTLSTRRGATRTVRKNRLLSGRATQRIRAGDQELCPHQRRHGQGHRHQPEMLQTDVIDLYQVHNIKKRPELETVLGSEWRAGSAERSSRRPARSGTSVLPATTTACWSRGSKPMNSARCRPHSTPSNSRRWTVCFRWPKRWISAAS